MSNPSSSMRRTRSGRTSASRVLAGREVITSTAWTPGCTRADRAAERDGVAVAQLPTAAGLRCAPLTRTRPLGDHPPWRAGALSTQIGAIFGSHWPRPVIDSSPDRHVTDRLRHDVRLSEHSIGGCGRSLGAASGHGCVLRVRRAADPPHPSRTAGPGRRARRPRCRRRRQLRGPRVRRPLGDAHASGPPAGRRRRGGAAAARCRLRRGQPPGPRHRAQLGARARAALVRRGVRRTRRTRRCHSRRRRAVLPAPCGPRSATRRDWSHPSAPARASRSPRSPPAWPSPTASGVVRRDEERALLDGAAGAAAVGHRTGRRGETAPARHRNHRPARGARPTPKPPTSWAATVGPALHRLARGIDDRPVAENAQAKQISAESTFPTDLTTLDQLREATGPIGEHAHARLQKDGRGARTVTVKLKKSDMSTLTRSATLPYATADAATLIGTARRLLLDPVEIGPIRLVGVGFSGLSDVQQESLFPDLEQAAEVSDTHQPVAAAAAHRRRPGASVTTSRTPTYGHGWVQGAGHGVMTVRFETRSTGPGPVRTLPDDTPQIDRANPVDSLDWPDYLSELAVPEPPYLRPDSWAPAVGAAVRARPTIPATTTTQRICTVRPMLSPSGRRRPRRVSRPPAPPSAAPGPAAAAAAAPPPRPASTSSRPGPYPGLTRPPGTRVDTATATPSRQCRRTAVDHRRRRHCPSPALPARCPARPRPRRHPSPRRHFRDMRRRCRRAVPSAADSSPEMAGPWSSAR